MRKDVKFGLTIGGILLATIAVYAIVLLHGGAGSPANPDVTLDRGNSVADTTGVTNSTGTDTSPSLTDHTDKTTAGPTTTPSDSLTSTSTPGTSANTATGLSDNSIASNEPSTQPTVTSDASDWDYALTHGQVKMLAAAEPQHTETPLLDRHSPQQPPPMDTDNIHPAMIDAPTTQPMSMNDLPALPSTSSNTPVTIDPTTSSNTPTSETPIGRSPSSGTPGGRFAAGPAAANGSREHVVERGETLSAIARAAYGNSKYYTRILAANPGLDAKHLRVGAKIILPALSATDRTVSSSTTGSTGSNAGTGETPVDSRTSYRVQSGDTLERIAEKLYGDSRMQDKLYDTNRKLIGPDENRLKIGMVLALPQPPSVASASR